MDQPMRVVRESRAASPASPPADAGDPLPLSDTEPHSDAWLYTTVCGVLTAAVGGLLHANVTLAAAAMDTHCCVTRSVGR